VNSTFLGRVRVNGAAAVLNTNVRVVEYGIGAVVIPHSPTFAPMEVFDGKSFTGASKLLRTYEEYADWQLGALKSSISSFRLKRGYTATVATNENGNGSQQELRRRGWRPRDWRAARVDGQQDSFCPHLSLAMGK
jgi:hypothetical protein